VRDKKMGKEKVEVVEEQKTKTLEDMNVTELKALLFDIDQEIKQRQNVYQQVAMQLQKVVNDTKKYVK
jgi:hypothetical protein